MSCERPLKKARTSKDAAVSVPGGKSGGTSIHLTPELVARVATFADSVCSPDVMNTCLAVGPDVSRTVRYYYLKRNVKYLARTIKRYCRGDIERKRARFNHLHWMKINADWRTFAVGDDLMDRLKLACQETESGQSIIDIFHPLIAFNNPAVAIQIGLFDPLKHLVEDKGIDVNGFKWSGFGSAERMHLLYYAAVYRLSLIHI